MSVPNLADRIGDLLPLSDDERAALDQLIERDRPVRRGATLVRENDRSTELFALKSGRMMAYQLLADGSRQIVRFVFPGDLTGTSVLVYGKAQQTLVAAADSVVAPIERAQLIELTTRHPRLAVAITALEQVERAVLSDRLAAMARTSAHARVAAVLLDIRDRLRRGDPSIGATFALGLTQEEIGDAIGLTAVHVNRMLRQLVDERLIARSGGRVTILDEARLRRVAYHTDRLAGVDLSWLVGPREA